jgi:hypothetical protein
MTRHSNAVWLLLGLAVAASGQVALARQVTREPQGSTGTVTLTRVDYDRLLDLATKTPIPANAAPVAAVLNRAEITVRIDAALARATMRIDGETYRTGITRVPLLKRATLIDARLADRALPMNAEGDLHVAMLTGPAPFSATLELGAPVMVTPGRASFTLPVPPAGSTTAVFDVPGDQADVHLSSGLIIARTSTNGRTRVDATLVPGVATQVWWGTRDSAATTGAREARLLADVKTLVTIGDADLRLFTLLDVTVVQGAPQQIDVRIPAGYEVSSVSGSSLDRTEARGDITTLFLAGPAQRLHHFLISLERQNVGGSFALETGFVSVPGAQRETGEVAVSGTGTLEVSGPEPAGMRRIDVRELDATLVSTARQSLLAAYRYQRTADARPLLTLVVTRFPDAAVLAAVAERAVATTLVTTEGRSLTEIVLSLRNHAQPFMKVALPEGATILSVEVGGSPAKPVTGSDGNRVPLLRPGFRPTGTYTVSFVYVQTGVPFLAKGDMRMALPRMDVPVGILEWEIFIPDRFRVDRFDGSAVPAALVERAGDTGTGFGVAGGVVAGLDAPVVDAVNEVISRKMAKSEAPQRPDNEVSINVQNLQRRASGVLPVRMDVPKAGTSNRFIRPLVVDEETSVGFRYRRR